MNRLSWDTTAPRRPGGKRAPQPRPEEMGLVEAEADLIRVAWSTPLGPLYLVLLVAGLFVVSHTDGGCQTPGRARTDPMNRKMRGHSSARAALSPADVPPSVWVSPSASS